MVGKEGLAAGVPVAATRASSVARKGTCRTTVQRLAGLVDHEAAAALNAGRKGTCLTTAQKAAAAAAAVAGVAVAAAEVAVEVAAEVAAEVVVAAVVVVAVDVAAAASKGSVTINSSRLHSRGSSVCENTRASREMTSFSFCKERGVVPVLAACSVAACETCGLETLYAGAVGQAVWVRISRMVLRIFF